MKTAFSLVELSIVLVILGLLTGGILAGQSLIRASELRSVTTDIQRYQTATHAFKDKYFGLPGDITNATDIWGKDGTYCNGASGSVNAITGTCNGDGNAQVASSSVVNVTGEGFQLWRQLALAGMIEGTYTGIGGPTVATVSGVNVPVSKIANGAYGLSYYTNAGDAWNYTLTYGNQLALLSVSGAGVLKPEELWNIDSKIDDGTPYAGKLVVILWASCTTSTSFSDFTGQYKLTSTSQTACGFRYRNII